MEIKTLEIAGFYSALKALHLPYSKIEKSFLVGETLPKKITSSNCGYHNAITYSEAMIAVADKDLTLLQALIKNGDEHAKVVRGINVWVEIKAPIYFWWDFETYIVGHQRLCSESTMNQECKGLTGEELQKAKGAISFGREVTKIDMLSYQTIARICRQRKNHRLPEFHQFIDWAKTLPFAEELIFTETIEYPGKETLDLSKSCQV